MKSKFDNESAEDTDKEDHENRTYHSSSQSSESEEMDHQDYVEDSPPKSPIELSEKLPVYLPAIQV